MTLQLITHVQRVDFVQATVKTNKKLFNRHMLVSTVIKKSETLSCNKATLAMPHFSSISINRLVKYDSNDSLASDKVLAVIWACSLSLPILVGALIGAKIDDIASQSITNLQYC